jgi:hypothetical protein
MQTRTINNIKFYRVRDPHGSKFLYYADGGPGGNLLAWNSAEDEQGTMNGLVDWDREPFVDNAPIPPKQEFNHGWR